MRTKSDYRPDIDGLRALAVIAVVFFHAFPKKFPGGFIGVDVFFVISGFLISNHILNDLNQNRFSFSDFYSRRISRIFPALILMLASVLCFGWFFFMADDYAALAKHTAGGIGFISNLVLLKETGYFDLSSWQKPLLHLWSLGIEEQFYIVWPMLLYTVRKKKNAPLILTGVLFTLSFVWNLILLKTNPSAAFYLPMTRFWELLLGCALAIHHTRYEGVYYSKLKPSAYEWAGALGLGIILFGFFINSEKSAFPGFYALLPSLGASLLIFTGLRSRLNRIMSYRPFVWIGLISYPLYLWHWPMLAILSKNLMTSRNERIAAIALSFVFSILTYLFLEKPLRRVRQGLRVSMLIGAAVLVGSLGILILQQDGFPNRFPAEITSIAKIYDTRSLYRFKKCFLDAKTQSTSDFAEECHPAKPAQKPIVLLWGDSHAAHLFHGLDANLDQNQFRLWQYSATSCPPLLHGDTTDNGNCASLIEFVKKQIEEEKPEVVILGSRWTRDSDHFDDKLKETAEFLFAKGVKQIFLFGPPPSWPPTIRDLSLKAYREAHVLPEYMTPDADAFTELTRQDAALQKACEINKVTYISVKHILCKNNLCRTSFKNGDATELVSSDYDHFTAMASEFVVRQALPAALLKK